MINKEFWKQIADNWSKEDDGIVIPDDFDVEATKARNIVHEDFTSFDDISDDEIDEILADLDLDDF